MPFPISCQCGQRFAANDSLAGKQVQCPNCGSPLVIPAITQTPPNLAVPTSTPVSSPHPQVNQTAVSPMQMGGVPQGQMAPQWGPAQGPAISKGLMWGLVASGIGLVVVLLLTMCAVLFLGGSSDKQMSRSGEIPNNSAGDVSNRYAKVVSSSEQTLNANDSSNSTAAAKTPTTVETTKLEDEIPKSELSNGELFRRRVTYPTIMINFSRDGRRLLRAGAKMNAYDTNNWQLIDIPNKNARPAKAISHDGCFGLSWGLKEPLVYWELDTGKVIQTLPVTNRVFSGAISPDGKRAAFGSRAIEVWDLERGHQLFETEAVSGNLFKDLISITFSKDGKRVYACDPHETYVYDAATGAEIVRFEYSRVKSGITSSRAFALNADRLIVSSGGEIVVYEMLTGRPVNRIVVEKSRPAAVVGACNDNGTAAFIIFKDMLAVLDIQNKKFVAEFGPYDCRTPNVSVHPDGYRLAIAGSKMWSVIDLTPYEFVRAPLPRNPIAATIPANPLAPVSEKNHIVRLPDFPIFNESRAAKPFVAMSGDGNFLLAGGSFGGARLWLYETATQQILGTRQFKINDRNTDRISCIALSPDATHAVSWGKQQVLWDAQTGKEIGRFEVEGTYQTGESADFSADGKTLLTVGRDNIIWDIETRRPICSLVGHETPVLVGRLLPENRAVTISERTAAFWDTERGKMLGTLSIHPNNSRIIRSASLSADGMRLLARDGSAIDLWDLKASRSLHRIDKINGENLLGLTAISPYGRYAVIDTRGRIHFWDLGQNQSISTFEINEGKGALDITFSANGQLVAVSYTGRIVAFKVPPLPSR